MCELVPVFRGCHGIYGPLLGPPLLPATLIPLHARQLPAVWIRRGMLHVATDPSMDRSVPFKFKFSGFCLGKVISIIYELIG